MKSFQASILATLASAASVFAQCAQGSDTLPGTFAIFTFSATGVISGPLNLVEILTVPETSFHVLSTAPATIDWQGFTMSGGGIEAVPPAHTAAVGSLGAVSVNAADPVPTPGPFPTWANSFVAASLWCALSDADRTHTLALNGRFDLFALCESVFDAPAGTTQAVVFNASASAVLDGPGTYDGASCVPVNLLAAPQ
ncbi:hypothetical protein PsYK624_055770 [Phanerochaete sordida]|uniref:Uncharacterized protein n=1 Tax=Phanerochaete sordida TaxID=48140 RepID=A0A9P3G762_9APHY|nr:hypothetical protein PsYK624_055770 [Phanerochaete sordida]